MGAKSKKCNMCRLSWNVSVKDKQENYICPVCEKRIPKVLLKNKNKFEGGIKL